VVHLCLPSKGFFLALIAAVVGFTFYSGSYEALPRLVQVSQNKGFQLTADGW